MKAEERETTCSYTDDGTDVVIYTCIRKDITTMKKKEQFTLVDEGKYSDGTLYANFTIPREKFDIGRAARSSRVMTDEAKQKLVERLAASRAEKTEAVDDE